MRTTVVITLLTLVAFGAVQAQSPAVDIPLLVSDGVGGAQQLRFGLDPSATDGINASLGEGATRYVRDPVAIGEDEPLLQGSVTPLRGLSEMTSV